VADRLFEGEEAVLHVIERIVAPLGLRVDATSPWVDRDFRTARGCRPDFVEPLSRVLPGSPCRRPHAPPRLLPAPC
jgi:Flp pilus assembly CpaF family ATPase